MGGEWLIGHHNPYTNVSKSKLAYERNSLAKLRSCSGRNLHCFSCRNCSTCGATTAPVSMMMDAVSFCSLRTMAAVLRTHSSDKNGGSTTMMSNAPANWLK